MLERSPERRLPSVPRAAASPGAIVLAGVGVAIAEAGHLGTALAVVLGAAGYGGRVAWAAVRRRQLLRRRSRRHLARVDPWSVPEPWRGYTVRSLEARKRLSQLAHDCPPGPVSDYLATAIARVDQAVEEQWGLARSGAALDGPPGRVPRVAAELAQVQAQEEAAEGADRAPLVAREEALAAELRSLRRTQAASEQLSARLSGLAGQLEALVAEAAQLVGAVGEANADLSSISSGLQTFTRALEEARTVVAPGAPGQPPAPGDG